MKKILIFLVVFMLAVSDVSAKAYDKYINDAFKDGIIAGDENGDFNSDKMASRAEFAVIAVNFLKLSGGRNTFFDVDDSDWFAKAFSAAAYNGILSGYDDGFMRPNDMITVEEAVTIVGRYYKAETSKQCKAEGVSGYARRYYAYAEENGLLKMGEKSFSEPKRFITKAEALALLYNYRENCEKTAHFLDGYPTISEKRVFNNISVEMKTNVPCRVYYGLATDGGVAAADGFLCDISAGNMLVTANIVVDINKTYDIYLKTVSENGAESRTAVIKNARPFTISQGNGTELSPYIVYTKEQLEQISDNPDKVYCLGGDIELDGEWKPIENFSGIMDGDGHKISGLYIDSDENSAGLFGDMHGTVKNLYLSGEVSAKSSVGIIAGKNYGMIENCSVSGSVFAKNNYGGGICGENYGSVKNCLSALYGAEAGSYSGGISGRNSGEIEKCLSACDKIFADMYSGGIAGINQNGKIFGCVSASMSISAAINRKGGRITTNNRNGITENNYCYEDTISDLDYDEIGSMTQSGEDIPWESCISEDFYYSIGWNKSIWKLPNNGFRIVCPSSAHAPELEEGRTIFFPKKISDASGLMDINKNEAGHYILTQNITLDAPWKTICAQNGFSGSLDGGGFSILNMKIKTETGMFSNIAGGTVRNLNIVNAYVMPDKIGSVLAACNYGFIENCTVGASAEVKRGGLFGGICAENFGQIRNCSVDLKIADNGDNSTIGGISADNGGMITDTKTKLKITSSGDNAVIGGICGYDTAGYIFESFSEIDISAGNKMGYYGGICGIAEKSRIYKCASSGAIRAAKGDVSAGGICAASDGGVVYNCYSAADISSSAPKAYAGGIAGYIGAESNLQNTYSVGNIIAAGGKSVYAGGICAYAEDSFVMQNVSLNPAINSAGFAGAVTAYYKSSEISDNFSCEKTLINSKRFFDSEYNGTVRSVQTLRNSDFYFRSVASGGALGWDNENVWIMTDRRDFPILRNVDGQDGIRQTIYK